MELYGVLEEYRVKKIIVCIGKFLESFYIDIFF